jgi:thiol-disulfide isomerase/thioredoxin
MRLIAIVALTVAPLCAQQYPDGATLTKQAEAAVRKYHSLLYKEEMTLETEFGGQPMKVTSEASRAVLNPGPSNPAKTRRESKIQGTTMLIVSDGESTWMYSSVRNEYTRKSAALGPEGIIAAMGIGDMMPNMADFHLTQKTIGEESVTIDGQKHDCWVVETRIGDMELPAAAKGARILDGVMTQWIDKKLGIDLQNTVSMKLSMPGGVSTGMHQKTVKKELAIDGPIDDSLFVFTPPEGAREVEKLSLFGAPGAEPDLAGKDAPQFSVAALDGKTYTLAALQGKPVLLDFWATWCVPCRASMPAVERIFQEYKDQGLAVLGVNTGEERDTVEQFLRKTPMAYPAVMAGESGILEAYKVTAYPTFVMIGRDGKIAAYEVGFGGEGMLRGMLEKAGLAGK